MAQELAEREECGCRNWRRGAIAGLFRAALLIPAGMQPQKRKGKGKEKGKRKGSPLDSSKQIPEGASVCSPEGQGKEGG